MSLPQRIVENVQNVLLGKENVVKLMKTIKALDERFATDYVVQVVTGKCACRSPSPLSSLGAVRSDVG